MTTELHPAPTPSLDLVANQPGWPAEKIDLVKATVAQGADDNELQMFLALADRYRLDPFAKEIWCIKDERGNVRIQGARDGFLAIANRHPAYEGITADVVYAGDEFERAGDGGVTHRYNLANRSGGIVGAYALVFRSDRRVPAFFFARMAEYRPAHPNSYSPWTKFPSAMILKVAEANALKRAFSISGIETEGETLATDDGPRPAYGDRPVQRLPRLAPPARPVDSAVAADVPPTPAPPRAPQTDATIPDDEPEFGEPAPDALDADQAHRQAEDFDAGLGEIDGGGE